MAANPNINKVEEAGLPIMQDVFGPILNRNVTVALASVEDANFFAIQAAYPENPVMVEVELEGALSGTLHFLYSQMISAAITDLMVMGDGTAPFNEQESLDGISEATNQIIGALCTFYSDKLKSEVRPSNLKGELIELDEGMLNFDNYVKVDYKIMIDDWGDAFFSKLIPKSMLDSMMPLAKGNLDLGAQPAQDVPDEQGQAKKPAAGAGMPPGMTPPGVPPPGMFDQGAGQPQMPPQQQYQAPPPQQQQYQMPPPMQQQYQMPPQQQYGPGPMVQPAAFAQFDMAEALVQRGDVQNLDLLLDISLPVTIELGRTHMLIRDVLEIGPGSVIELNKLSGEPVDLYVNDKRFAMGEVVVIDENFGIRITELLREEDRIKALGA